MWLREGRELSRVAQGGGIPPQLSSQMQSLQLGTQAMLGMQVLTLGVMVAGFAMLNAKLGRIEQKLDQVMILLGDVKEELSWLNQRKDAELISKLRAALRQAQWLEDTGRREKLAALRLNFVEVEENCGQLLMAMLKNNQAHSRAELFLQYFMLLCLAGVSRVRLEAVLDGVEAGLIALDAARQTVRELAKRFHRPLFDLPANSHLMKLTPSARAKVVEIVSTINEARGRMYSYRTELEWCSTHKLDLHDWENLSASGQEEAALVFIRPMEAHR